MNYNTVDMTMQIAPTKVNEAAGMCRAFLASISMTRHEKQSFMGKVLHTTKCTTAARRFANRLLDFLRSLPNKGNKPIPHEARLDALWLTTFLQAFNGLTLIKPPIAGLVAFVDAYPPIPQFRDILRRLAVLVGVGKNGYTPHSLRRGGPLSLTRRAWAWRRSRLTAPWCPMQLTFICSLCQGLLHQLPLPLPSIYTIFMAN